jgi:murein DD-endopeptidase MepM/ murein hydrolase activator NlpD
MGKVKYYFNPKTLTYEQYKPKIWKRLLRIGSFLSVSLFFAFIMLLAFYYSVDSPKERQLKRIIQHNELHFNLLSQRVEQLQAIVEDLEDRDDNVYRVIFEAEPISKSVRSAGFGGVEKYRNLEGYYNSDNLKKLNHRVDQLTKQLYILSKSYDEISELATKKSEMLASIPAIQPVSNKDLSRIASGFGFRIHPVYKAVKFHEGLDFSAPQGTEIYATGDGVIAKAEFDRRGFGNYVVIDHGYGYQTVYAHMQKYTVKVGQRIKRGELLGYIGNTGMSTAPHLHYEVIKNGKKVNPINFFFNDLTPEEYEKVVELANQPNQSFD